MIGRVNAKVGPSARVSGSVSVMREMRDLDLADPVHQLLAAAAQVRSAPKRIAHAIMVYAELESFSSVEGHKDRVVGDRSAKNGSLDSSGIFLHANITSHLR
ncbi:hypothetical protein [Nonomuraea dietziae]|uniref:Uncharacterized protein n=1 Tax=Nonomuraea dietziae TaxID=65515 RepID=A0A7W5VEA3_9ACTN|nr:hypothetical protein [Nonomuraea dietziae]MBB3730335.1 hypothetical protein [Nonomuraea dietziae]